MPTLLQLHQANWKDGCGSTQCGHARKCFRRGALPCDVLFVGEAPGSSEDDLGKPFVGPAGWLLDNMIAEASHVAGLWDGPWPLPVHADVTRARLRYAFTNVVLCIPRDPENPIEWVEPDKHQIKACRPRLLEFLPIADPRLIVRCGKIAHGGLDEKLLAKVGLKRHAKTIDVHHPSYLMRQPADMRHTLRRRWVVQLATALGDLK